MTPGKDAFLGRGINGIVIDPRNKNHIFVGSAQAVRGLSHMIGNGGTTRLEPGANQPGLYESTDGGQTFTEVWNGNIAGRLRRHRRRPRPAATRTSSTRRRSTRAPGGVTRVRQPTAFSQVFAPQFNQGAGIDRTMFALTPRTVTRGCT